MSWWCAGFLCGAWNLVYLRREEVEAIALAGGEPACQLVLGLGLPDGVVATPKRVEELE